MSIKYPKYKGNATAQAVITLTVVLLTMLAVWLLLVTQPETRADLEQLPPLSVVVQKVAMEELQPFEKVAGRLQPRRMATLRFEVTGQLVTKYVEPGMSVAANASLLALDASDYRDRVTQARMQLKIEAQDAVRDQRLLSLAQENVRIQQREVDRLIQLSADNLISHSQLDGARQALLEMRAEVTRLQRQVETASARKQVKQMALSAVSRELDRTLLKAPFSGVVNEVMVEVGDYIAANQAAVTLVDMQAFDLELNLRHDLAEHLHLGQSIELTVTDDPYQGTVVALQPNADLETYTYQARIRIQQPQVLAGTLATALIPTGERSKYLKVPVTAVLYRNGRSFVFVYQDGSVRKVAVELGQRVGSDYVVLGGLNRQNEIVARDVSTLEDGQSAQAFEN